LLENLDNFYNLVTRATSLAAGTQSLIVTGNSNLLSLSGFCGLETMRGPMTISLNPLLCRDAVEAVLRQNITWTGTQTFTTDLTPGPCAANNDFRCNCKSLPDFCPEVYGGNQNLLCSAVRFNYTCAPVYCYNTTYELSTIVGITNGGLYPCNATFECKSGYQTAQSLVRGCRKDSTWDTPTCIGRFSTICTCQI
jgi:hypothetical protein